MSHIVTQRIVLHRNGDPIHFDITVDFQKLARGKAYKAERSRSHKTKLAEGAIIVEHVP
jgi:hypothetical protein